VGKVKEGEHDALPDGRTRLFAPKADDKERGVAIAPEHPLRLDLDIHPPPTYELAAYRLGLYLVMTS
jgi:hypothetical protein